MMQDKAEERQVGTVLLGARFGNGFGATRLRGGLGYTVEEAGHGEEGRAEEGDRGGGIERRELVDEF